MRILQRAAFPTLLGATVLAFAGAVVAVEATTGAAAPQAAMTTPAPTPAERFRALDVDADGALSRAEAEASPALRDRFDEADADASGTLSEAEYVALVSADGAMPEAQAEAD